MKGRVEWRGYTSSKRKQFGKKEINEVMPETAVAKEDSFKGINEEIRGETKRFNTLRDTRTHTQRQSES